MKIIRPILSVVLSMWLLFPPTIAKADHPVGTLIVSVAIPFALVAGTAVIARVMDDSSETETKETDQDQEETQTTDSTDDSGGEDESRGENEGTASSAPAKPKVHIGQFVRGSWFTSTDSKLTYTSRVPTALSAAANGRAARTRSVAGVGVTYRTAKDEGNVSLAPTAIRKIEFAKSRSTKFQITRAGSTKKALQVPVVIKLSELSASTTDVIATNGSASNRLRLLVDGSPVLTSTVSVAQGQAGVVSGDIGSSDATIVQQSDFSAVKDYNDTVKVTIPRGKRSVTVTVEVVSTGIGQRI